MTLFVSSGDFLVSVIFNYGTRQSDANRSICIKEMRLD